MCEHCEKLKKVVKASELSILGGNYYPDANLLEFDKIFSRIEEGEFILFKKIKKESGVLENMDVLKLVSLKN